MGIRNYLAMIREELENCPALPPKIGFMACHFSPYGVGLTDLPTALPPGSLLFCDDRIPIAHHDARLVAAQLSRSADHLKCSSIVLDFQEEENPALREVVRQIAAAAPCPVAVTPPYAKESSGPVLLPPCPLLRPIAEVCKDWPRRELWMEWARQAIEITVTERDAAFSLPRNYPEDSQEDRVDPVLCCRYRFRVEENRAIFLLWDSVDSLKLKASAAEAAGITTLIGLYQQFAPLAASTSSPRLSR